MHYLLRIISSKRSKFNASSQNCVNFVKSVVVSSFIKYYNNLVGPTGCMDNLESMNQSIHFYESEVKRDEPRHVR